MVRARGGADRGGFRGCAAAEADFEEDELLFEDVVREMARLLRVPGG